MPGIVPPSTKLLEIVKKESQDLQILCGTFFVPAQLYVAGGSCVIRMTCSCAHRRAPKHQESISTSGNLSDCLPGSATRAACRMGLRSAAVRIGSGRLRVNRRAVLLCSPVRSATSCACNSCCLPFKQVDHKSPVQGIPRLHILRVACWSADVFVTLETSPKRCP